MSVPTLGLWSTESCPASHCLRERLAELRLAYIVRRVTVQREDRAELVLMGRTAEG